MEIKILGTDSERRSFVFAWENAFKRKLDSAVYPWIFNSNNDLYAIIIGGEVAAGYCLMRYKAVLHGKIVDAALCNNVFVLSKYRGQNLFMEIGVYALSEAEKKGIKIVLGIPNKSALPGHKKIGWTELNPIPFLEKVPIKTNLNFKLTDNIKSINCQNLLSWIDKIEDFSYEISGNRSFSIIKTKDYFKWRYFDRPGVNYSKFLYEHNGNVKGYLIIKYYEPSRRVHIIDIEAQDSEIYEHMIRVAETYFQDYSLLNVWGSSAYKSEFMRNGFVLGDEQNFLIVIDPYRKETVSLGDNVNIVLGDNDVY
jgi:hypothetical protein